MSTKISARVCFSNEVYFKGLKPIQVSTLIHFTTSLTSETTQIMKKCYPSQEVHEDTYNAVIR